MAGTQGTWHKKYLSHNYSRSGAAAQRKAVKKAFHSSSFRCAVAALRVKLILI